MKAEPQKDVHTVEVATSTTDAIPSVAKAPGHWSVFRNRNYALLFWGQLISAAGTQMQIVAGIVTPQFSVISGGAACIVATLIIAAIIPRLLKVRVNS